MKKNSVGFTLIELLVVISIIGILAALTLVSFGGAQKQARDTQRKSDLNQVKNALENYAGSNNGMYPIQAVGNVTGVCGTGQELDENFISFCPTDPLDGTTARPYYYGSADGSAYILYAQTETTPYWFTCSTGKSGSSASAPDFSSCN